jgi:hypothetical protein
MASKSLQHALPVNATNFTLLAAIFVQFSIIGISALFIQLFHIPFDWYPLFLKNVSSNLELWGLSRLFLVYGGIPLAFFAFGLMLYFILISKHTISWRVRLLISWISFYMVNNFLAGIIASLFAFDGIGVALIWMFPNFYMRLMLAILVALVLVFTRPFWEKLFMKAVYSKTFLRDRRSRNDFINQVFRIPWMFTTLLFLIFGFLSGMWFWGLSLVSMGLVIFGIKWYKPIPDRTKIVRDQSQFIGGTTSYVVLIILVTIILLNGIWG